MPTGYVFPGHAREQCDAEKAHVQSKLGGTPTWVELLKERRPKGWGKFRRPVCRLVLSLYGHPDAGGYWEPRCIQKLVDGGFSPVHEILA